MMCEGADRDDVLFHHHALVERYGWAAVAVVDDGRWDEAWLYTIGLTGVDHAELVIVGVPPDRCGAILEDLAERVLEGEALVPGTSVDVLGVEVDLLRVHPLHLEGGLVNCALEYYDALGWPPGCVDAVQVVVPAALADAGGLERDVPRLDDPSAWSHPVGKDRPNRARRRAAERKHRHRGR